MKRQSGGWFVRHLPTPAETFEYKFIIDGQWRTDPDNPAFAPDPFGSFNSVSLHREDVVLGL